MNSSNHNPSPNDNLSSVSFFERFKDKINIQNKSGKLCKLGQTSSHEITDEIFMYNSKKISNKRHSNYHSLNYKENSSKRSSLKKNSNQIHSRPQKSPFTHRIKTISHSSRSSSIPQPRDSDQSNSENPNHKNINSKHYLRKRSHSQPEESLYQISPTSQVITNTLSSSHHRNVIKTSRERLESRRSSRSLKEKVPQTESQIVSSKNGSEMCLLEEQIVIQNKSNYNKIKAKSNKQSPQQHQQSVGHKQSNQISLSKLKHKLDDILQNNHSIIYEEEIEETAKKQHQSIHSTISPLGDNSESNIKLRENTSKHVNKNINRMGHESVTKVAPATATVTTTTKMFDIPNLKQLEENYRSICLKKPTKNKILKSTKSSRLPKHQLESIFNMKIEGLPKIASQRYDIIDSPSESIR